MFNKTNSTKIFAQKHPRIKIRIPKLEISNKQEHSNPKFKIQNDLGKNPKSEYRNTKQFQNLNSQNPKPFNENFSHVFKCFEISILSFPFLFRVSNFVLRILFSICFEFRISSFEFIYTWRALRLCGSPRGIPTRPRSSCSSEALFHRARHLVPDSVIESFKYLWLGYKRQCHAR